MTDRASPMEVELRPQHVAIIDAIYAHLLDHSKWPKAKQLDVELDAKGFDFKSVVSELNDFVRGTDLYRDEEETKLTLAGLAVAARSNAAARSDLDLIRQVFAVLGKKYRADPFGHSVPAQEVLSELPVPPDIPQLRRVLLIGSENTLLSSHDQQHSVPATSFHKSRDHKRFAAADSLQEFFNIYYPEGVTVYRDPGRLPDDSGPTKRLDWTKEARLAKKDTDRSGHIFSADRPRQSAKEDLLGRTRFAQELAATLGAWSGDDSLVLAVYGEWGIGKTSLKNFIVEALPKQAADVVEFNPWDWSAQGKLITGFFGEVGRALGMEDRSGRARIRERAWRRYAAHLGLADFTFQSVRKAATWLVGSIGVLALLSPAVANWAGAAVTSTATTVVGAMFIIAAGLIYYSQGVFERLAGIQATRTAEFDNISLSTRKKGLAELLAGRERSLLVIIDDIDRLTPTETAHLFQLLKANADFPKLVYLLLCQRDIVEEHLKAATDTDGRAFLEKIVQVAFDVPAVESSRLYQALFTGLNRILEEKALQERFDKEHWGNVFLQLRYWFRTLRQVSRFLGSFSFHANVLRRGNTFEVNPVDLIALEAIRMFDPDLYAAIRDSKEFLVDDVAMFRGRQFEADRTSALERILGGVAEGRRQHVRDLMVALFPTISGSLGGDRYSSGDRSGKWYRDLRVCSAKVFDRYFLLAIEKDDVSQADLDALRGSAGDREAVRSLLMGYVARGGIDTLLDRLDYYREEIPLEVATPFITAVFDVGDFFPRDAPGFFSFSADLMASRLVHWILKRFPTHEDRQKVFMQAVRDTAGLWLPIKKVNQNEDKRDEQKHPEMYFLTKEQIQEMKTVLLGRIRAYAADESLVERSVVAPILWAWKEWGSSDEPREWATDFASDSEKALSLTEKFVASQRIVGGGTEKVRYRVELDAIATFIPIERLTPLIEQADPDGLDNRLEITRKAYLEALERRAKGQSYEEWEEERELDL